MTKFNQLLIFILQKLYGNKDNFRTQKVLIAAKLANKTVTLAGDAAPADKFPLGVVRFNLFRCQYLTICELSMCRISDPSI